MFYGELLLIQLKGSATCKQLTRQGISVILIGHDMQHVFDLLDRVVVLKNGAVVGTAGIGDVTVEEVLGI